jgi:23S rRNA (uridine2552-2'-O)-methyltransferase
MRRSEDHFSRRAREQGFPARSVYKLQEMQERFRLIRPGARILDLGAAPGSWSQFCLEQLAGRGRVVAIDLNEPSFRPPEGGAEFRFLKGDLFSAEVERTAAELGPYDLVLSDAAPHTSGSSLVDAQASLELAIRAFELACSCLRPGGNLVLKVFQGGEEGALLARIRAGFAKARAFKPGASRSESREVYFLGFNFSGDIGRIAPG